LVIKVIIEIGGDVIEEKAPVVIAPIRGQVKRPPRPLKE
jgi:hypothetical protein